MYVYHAILFLSLLVPWLAECHLTLGAGVWRVSTSNTSGIILIRSGLDQLLAASGEVFVGYLSHTEQEQEV